MTTKMTPELAALLARRDAADAEITAATQRFDAVNAEIVALAAQHKVGDKVPYDRAGKKWTLLVNAIDVTKNTTSGAVYLHYRGVAVRADGTVGTKPESFSVLLAGQPSTDPLLFG